MRSEPTGGVRRAGVVSLVTLLALLCSAASERAGADVLASLTARPTAVTTQAYFGTHIHRLAGAPAGEPGTTPWPVAAGLGHVRLWDSGVAWLDLQREPGRWDFRRLDAYVQAAESHRASVLYTLGLTPRWASARPTEACPYGQGCSAEPKDLALWREYVRAIATRYGARIQAYELWNEPNFSDIPRDRGHPSFYSGSVATLVEMARIARETLDQTHPTALLCTPGFVNGPDRLALFLEAGGGRHVQAVCYHFYATSVRAMAEEVRAVRLIMQQHGLGALPLWNTETGVELHAFGEPPNPLGAETPEAIAARMAQLMIVGVAAGLDRYYQYAWDSHRSGMFHANGSARPGATVLPALRDWLEGARIGPCRQWDDLAKGLVACTATRGDQRELWLWVDGPDAVTLPFEALAPLMAPGAAVKNLQLLFDGGSASGLSAALGQRRLRIDRTPLRLTLTSPRS